MICTIDAAFQAVSNRSETDKAMTILKNLGFAVSAF